MSRVRVLNLPSAINEVALRDHFAGVAHADQITDCKIIRDRTTKKPRMAFVGFATTVAGERAAKKLNGSFIGSQRIAVEGATGLSDSKLSPFSSKGRLAAAKRSRETLPVQERNDVKRPPPALSVHKGMFVNERIADHTHSTVLNEVLVASPLANDEKNSQKDDVFLAKQRRLEKVSDADFLATLSSGGDNGDKAIVECDAAPSAPTCRVYVSNIPFSASESAIKNYFSNAGTVLSAHIPLTRESRMSKGCAYVTFNTAAEATTALEFNGAVFMGRLIKVVAAEADPYAQESHRESAPTFKQQRENEKKDSDLEGAWNPLYISSNAAVSAVAKKLHVDISNIVGVDNAGAAVRAAIAEAHVTGEARKILGDEGIDFERTQGRHALHRDRSNTTILVKNVAHTARGEISRLFGKFGPIDIVAAPSQGNFVLVAFLNSQDARTAFARLAYRKFNGVPLFLEWAAVGSIKDDAPNELAPPTPTAIDGSNASTTVYVTNIPFGATEDEVVAAIRDWCPRVASRPELLSGVSLIADKGRAYVKCVDESTTSYVIARLQGRNIRGRPVHAEISRTKATAAVEDVVTPVPSGCNPLKILVKNLPFEATEDDLRKLFAAFTDVRAVRVPRRHHQFNAHHTNNHRGFGFIEFLTAKEAANAMTKLAHTHLYGRHLVLEYAKVNEGASLGS